ncbi:MAG: hypothetical protein HFJ87_10425 [Muribaculaceae bacterium]|nr:hypothetical protein [Muribaculaceae bacterium]MCI9055536.1 hypothetical protein [Muribaculaceae bacterium]
MKYSRAIIVPALLLVYLAVMAYLGLDGLRSGQTSLAAYVATIVVSLGVIVLLHFFLKKRERLRRERMEDLLNNRK